MKVVSERRLAPFLDFAYQGFGEGIEEDAEVVRRFAEAMPLVLVAISFSKSFSLYGERVGALSVVTADSGEAARVLSHLKPHDPHQLLEPAVARRPGSSRRSSPPRAEQALEERGRRHARPRPPHAAEASNGADHALQGGSAPAPPRPSRR